MKSLWGALILLLVGSQSYAEANSGFRDRVKDNREENSADDLIPFPYKLSFLAGGGQIAYTGQTLETAPVFRFRAETYATSYFSIGVGGGYSNMSVERQNTYWSFYSSVAPRKINYQSIDGELFAKLYIPLNALRFYLGGLFGVSRISMVYSGMPAYGSYISGVSFGNESVSSNHLKGSLLVGLEWFLFDHIGLVAELDITQAMGSTGTSFGDQNPYNYDQIYLKDLNNSLATAMSYTGFVGLQTRF